MNRPLVILAGIIAFLSATGAGAVSLVPLEGDPGGQSGATSAQDWAEWVLSFDRDVDGGDPINDTTGAFQNKKQTFPVQLIAGGTIFNPTPTHRFTAQAGKTLMVPLLTRLCVGGSPTVTTCKGPDETDAKQFIDDAGSLFLEIDGETFVGATDKQAVDAIEAQFLVDSGIFPVEIAPNNLFTPFTQLVAAGSYKESFHKGFFAFVDLPIGTHSLTFGGASQDFSNTVSAEINIVPVPPTLPLLAVGLAVLVGAARRFRPG